MRFEALLKKISPTLRRITYRLGRTAGYCQEPDLYQEALIHLWQEVKAGVLEDKTDSYILQGCYFHLKNYLRTHRDRATLISVDSLQNEDADRITESRFFMDPASARLRDELHNKLLAETIMNNGLTDREKLLLSFCAQGLTTRQAGARLGVSHVRVVKILQCINKKCRKYLDPA